MRLNSTLLLLILVLATSAQATCPSVVPTDCSLSAEWTLVSVGSGQFCAPNDAVLCSGATNTVGICPGPQAGLEFGSACSVVDVTGGLACLPLAVCVDPTTSVSAPITSSSAAGSSAAPQQEIASAPVWTSAGSSSAPTQETGTQPEVATASADGCAIDLTIPELSYCDHRIVDGWTSISVEHSASFCTRPNAAGQYCVANISNGACPAPQKGLPYGSECQLIHTGVYGCVVRSHCGPVTPTVVPTMMPTTTPAPTEPAPCVELPPIKIAP
ncbi:hypothetical protein ACHHYP_00770 [Achlya hypogyna]|uniref:Secreted protein n=1 Tax=Achlya hypogyna TaxID=1202772 RepID=A0A0A7CLP7_ACHHY|nr:secreted protein [Achlya hypogyna]OQS01457.1 hypothetical protein ACHHYP_00770 [Achlya hypogyna]